MRVEQEFQPDINQFPISNTSEILASPTITGTIIDPQNAIDHDDAFTFSTQDDILTAHIILSHPANQIVKFDNPIFQQALRLVRSNYNPYIGMLPDDYMNQHSLGSNPQSTLVISVPVSSSPPYHQEDPILQFKSFQANQVLSYQEADERIFSNSDFDSVFIDLILTQHFLQLVNQQTPNITVRRLPFSQHRITGDHVQKSHLIIEHLMRISNQAVAKYAQINDIPILHRNHSTKDINSQACQHLCSHHRCHHINDNGHRKAFYCSTPIGHEALKTSHYAQSTSPLRRVVDLINQMQIHAHLTLQPYPFSRKQLNHLAGHIQTHPNGHHTILLETFSNF